MIQWFSPVSAGKASKSCIEHREIIIYLLYWYRCWHIHSLIQHFSFLRRNGSHLMTFYVFLSIPLECILMFSQFCFLAVAIAQSIKTQCGWPRLAIPIHYKYELYSDVFVFVWSAFSVWQDFTLVVVFVVCILWEMWDCECVVLWQLALRCFCFVFGGGVNTVATTVACGGG